MSTVSFASHNALSPCKRERVGGGGGMSDTEPQREPEQEHSSGGGGKVGGGVQVPERTVEKQDKDLSSRKRQEEKSLRAWGERIQGDCSKGVAVQESDGGGCCVVVRSGGGGMSSCLGLASGMNTLMMRQNSLQEQNVQQGAASVKMVRPCACGNDRG